MKREMIGFLCRMGVHNYTPSHNTGVNYYYECVKCGKRKVIPSIVSGYQPIDFEWLNRETKDKKDIPNKVKP